MRRALLMTAALIAAFGAFAPDRGPAALPAARAADEAPRKTVDADAVFFGDAREWSKPAEVDADAVYAQIEEYKRIVEEKIDPSDPKYGVLMSKARKRFLAAVRTVAKDGGYDLVARLGSVQGVAGVPNLTQDVIGKL